MIDDHMNATPNPCTAPAACAAPIASGVAASGGFCTRKAAVVVAAIVFSSAVPIEPPTCWAVCTTALATPASSWLTPTRATLVVDMKTKPMPTAMISCAGSRVAQVGRLQAEPGQPEQPDHAQQQTGRDDETRAEPEGQLRADTRTEDDADAERQEGEPGLDRGVLQHALQVVGQEQEDGEQAGADQQPDHVGAGPVPVLHDPHRQQRTARTELDQHERRPAGPPRRPTSPGC